MCSNQDTIHPVHHFKISGILQNTKIYYLQIFNARSLGQHLGSWFRNKCGDWILQKLLNTTDNSSSSDSLVTSERSVYETCLFFQFRAIIRFNDFIPRTCGKICDNIFL